MIEALKVQEFAEWEGDVDVFGNVGFRRITFDYPGQVLPGHEHNYPHATICAKGSVRLVMHYRDGHSVARTVHAPEIFEVPADVRHEMKSLEVGTVCYCSFAVRDEKGEVVELVKVTHLRDKSWHERRS